MKFASNSATALNLDFCRVDVIEDYHGNIQVFNIALESNFLDKPGVVADAYSKSINKLVENVQKEN